MWVGRGVTAIALILSVVLGVYALEKELNAYGNTRLMVRNFYDALSVYEVKPGFQTIGERTLYSGTVAHGKQFSAHRLARRPTSYFGLDSGIGLVLRSADQAPRPQHVGVIGLGAGTLAAYGRRGDLYRFYEINPLDIKIAQTQFTFLRESPAHVTIVPGDARLSLEREPKQLFNVLVVDAFTGDSPPVHLLTEQAFRLYFRHLTPKGVLAVNVTNAYLNLAPVIARAASALGKSAVLIENPEAPEELISSAKWVLVFDNSQAASRIAQVAANAIQVTRDEVLNGSKATRLWTDDYSDVLGALK
jgi:spermidine synthase